MALDAWHIGNRSHITADWSGVQLLLQSCDLSLTPAAHLGFYRALARLASRYCTDRLLGRYGAGSVASLSFDKGFTREEDRELLSLYVPAVVMPKRGKKNAAETERESAKRFVALRQLHSAVESEINSLEHHGLNRCLDMGLEGYLRYVGYGVMSYNLHQIGRQLLARASG